jgi:hypothetical protein
MHPGLQTAQRKIMSVKFKLSLSAPLVNNNISGLQLIFSLFYITLSYMIEICALLLAYGKKGKAIPLQAWTGP